MLLVVLIATEAYSAVRLATAHPTAGSLAPSLGANDTALLSGTFYLPNDGLYPLTGFSIAFEVRNASGTLVGQGTAGPASAAPGENATVAATLAMAVAPGSPGASLLVRDQPLRISVSGNLTVGYLFPVEVTAVVNHTWGAPFNGLTVTPGTPTYGGGSIQVPVTVAFSDDAPFADAGNVQYTVQPSSGTACTSGAWTVNVPPGQGYDQTQTISVPTSCPTTGTQLELTYVTAGVTIALPPEAFP